MDLGTCADGTFAKKAASYSSKVIQLISKNSDKNSYPLAH